MHEQTSTAYSGVQIPPTFTDHGSNQNYVPAPDQLRCNKCSENRLVTLRTVKKDYVPPYLYLTFVLGILIGLLVVLAVRVQHVITVPFCSPCWKKSRNADILAGLSLGGFFLSLITGVVAMLNLNSGWGFLLPTVPAVAFMIWAVMNKKKRNPAIKRMDRKQVIVSTASGDVVFAK